jgi:manganese transport protein
MQNIMELFLGILSAMGGFVEIGELVFALNAGAKFGYSLLWVALLGTGGIIVYAEMAGRIAAVTGLSIFDIIRDRVETRPTASPAFSTKPFHKRARD